MSKIVREDRDALNATLTVTIEQADYLDSYEKQLNKYRKQAQIKGFRIGKTPLPVIRKMFGRPILADLVHQELEKQVNDYIKAADLKLLGQPIPADDQEAVDFDPKAPEDYTFTFDLGIQPDITTVAGLEQLNVYEAYMPEVSDEQVEEEWAGALKTLTKRVAAETIADGDYITTMALEMVEGEVKEDGIATEISLLIDTVNDQAKAALMGKAVGDSIIVEDIFQLEPALSESYVRKHLLHIEDEEAVFSPSFQLSIKSISRLQEPEANQEAFDQLFEEGQVTTEDEAKAEIRRQIGKGAENQSNALFFRKVQDRLLELNEVPLPDDFLKRWLLLTNDKNTPESIEEGYANITRGIRWSIIANQLYQQYDVVVNEDDVRQAFLRDVLGYFGGRRTEWMTDDFIDAMTDRMMQNEDEVERKYYSVLTDKLVLALRSSLNVVVKTVPPDDFSAMIQELMAKVDEEDTDDLFDDGDEEEEE